jgi:hypothetical protein
MLINQPTSKPTKKVTAVGVAGLSVTALIALLAAFGVTVPDALGEQAVAAVGGIAVAVSFIQAAVTFIAGYMKREDA